MSNLERLVQAGVVDASEISLEQSDLINGQMTDEEVKNLISSKTKLGDHLVVPKADGGAF